MIMQSARARALVFAAITMGVIGCDSVQTTQPLKSTQPAIGVPHSGTKDVVSQTYTSGSQVMTWNAIPETNQPAGFAPVYCTSTPHVGINAAWQNPHNAFVVYHPWQNTIPGAPWINAWSDNQSTGGNPVAPHYNWTKYETQVTGNGTFQISLVADNCSWIYLDGTLVGVQGDTGPHAQTYGLSLNGTHTLTFVVFDGGGASGGQYKLETTSNPPPPLNPDLDGDGYVNTSDAFPLDPHEWVDTDGDGFGDNGDAFPTNPAEHLDSDHDGVGDNADAYPNDPTRTSLDATAPVITPGVVGEVGANGWYKSDVAVTWAVVDDESPATESGCDALTLTENQTEQSYTCTATSGGGTATQSVSVKIDKTRPTVNGAVTSGTLGANGWYVDDIGVTWTPSAAGPSGQTLASSCSTTSLTANSGSYTFNCSVTTGAGVSSAPATITVKRDATNPTIGYSGNALIYALDQNVAITCSYGDAMSGVATQSCANINGVAYTFGFGAHSYSASVTDNAGNTNSAATTFTVRATPASLCAMTRQFVTGPGELGVENSLCGKLDRGDYAPYINEVQAQSGKKISAANASLLILWARSL